MNILIEVETEDEKLASDLMEAPKKINNKTNLPGNVVLMQVQPSQTSEEKYIFMLNIGGRVAPDFLANWLHQKLKDRATRLFLDRKEVQIERSEIEQIISERIEKNNSFVQGA
jgi:hypothetical protein